MANHGYYPPTVTGKVVRRLAGKDAIIFNDRMEDGARSVKVYGWGEKDYKRAAKKLRKLGHDAIISKRFVPKRGWDKGYRIQCRLQVVESTL